MKNNITRIMRKVIQHAETFTGNGVPFPGIPTGYVDLDETLSGFQPGELILLAGIPAMGKSLLALNVAWNIASKTQKPVVYFSFEKSSESLARCIMSRVGRINRLRLKRGSLQENDWQNLTTAFHRIASAPIHLVDEVLDIEGMKEYVGQVKESIGDPGLIVVDGLQAIPNTHEHIESASIILKKLKLVAREFEAPVIIISELSRALESREDKRPVLSDISNHEAIIPQCDVVLSIYRDEVYDENSKEKGIAQIIVHKQSYGGIAIIKLSFCGEYGRFDDALQAQTSTFL